MKAKREKLFAMIYRTTRVSGPRGRKLFALCVPYFVLPIGCEWELSAGAWNSCNMRIGGDVKTSEPIKLHRVEEMSKLRNPFVTIISGDVKTTEPI